MASAFIMQPCQPLVVGENFETFAAQHIRHRCARLDPHGFAPFEATVVEDESPLTPRPSFVDVVARKG